MPRVTMLLCDAAQVADGKLQILGGGWSVTGPSSTPSAIACLLSIDWTGAPVTCHWELFLEDADGKPVFVQGQDGQIHPIEMRGDVRMEHAQPVAPGVPVQIPLAFNLAPLPLQPNSRYQWRLLVDGQADDNWTLAFSTLPYPPEA